MVIESMHNPLFKELMKLKTKKGRKESGLFLVEGIHLVEEAMAHGVCEAVISTTPSSVFPKNHVLSFTLFDKLADVDSPSSILGLCRVPTKSNPGERILLLDRIQDPGNLGTLIRSAHAFGFDTVIAEDTVDLYNAKVIRATQGALFGLCYQEMPIEDYLKDHPELRVIGTDVKGGVGLSAAPVPTTPFAIILGNEGHGVRPDLLKRSALRITIEMDPSMESLNVGVAGSILMYHFRKRG